MTYVLYKYFRSHLVMFIPLIASPHFPYCPNSLFPRSPTVSGRWVPVQGASLCTRGWGLAPLQAPDPPITPKDHTRIFCWRSVRWLWSLFAASFFLYFDFFLNFFILSVFLSYFVSFFHLFIQSLVHSLFLSLSFLLYFRICSFLSFIN